MGIPFVSEEDRKKAEKIILDLDKEMFPERVKRVQFIESLNINTTGSFSFNFISHHYFLEARRCWLDGSFVATIIMVQLAFEEGLRNVFRQPYLWRDEDYPKLQKINKKNFGDLIELAKTNKFITVQESKILHKLRGMRNPFVHVKRIREERWNFDGNSESSIFAKISEYYSREDNDLGDVTLEREAKQAIKLLKLFYKIFRTDGLGDYISP